MHEKRDRVDKGPPSKPATQSLRTELVDPPQPTRQIDTLNAPVRPASSTTGSGMGRGKAFLPNQPQQRATETQISLDSEKNDQQKLAQRQNPPSQPAASTSVSQAISGNAFSMQKKSANSNMSDVNDTCTTGSSAKTSAQSKSSTSPTTNKDGIDNNDNARDVYQKVAARVKEAKRQLAESQVQNKSPPASSNTEDLAVRKAPETLDDIIDLTEDSPPHEPPSDDDAPSVGSAPSTHAIKQNDEDTVISQPPSPPASPIPPPTIHSPPPSAKPNPKPFTLNRNLLFLEDRNPVPTSGCLDPRPPCTVAFDTGYHLDGSGSCLDDAHRINVNQRLQTWEP